MVPSWVDPVVARATTVIGGPAGRHTVIGAWGLAGVAAAVTLMGAAMTALGVFQKGHCVVKGWVSPDHFWRACYSDVSVVHVSSDLANRTLPYGGDTPSDQPLLSGLVMWLLSLISPRVGTDLAAQQSVFGLWAIAVVLLLAAGVVAVVLLRPTRPWQAAHLAASPVIAVLALVSVDLVGVVLVLYAVLAWQRSHPVAAGMLLGTAFLMRPYPLVVLIAIVLVARHQGPEQVRRAAQAVVAALLTGVVIFLGAWVAVGDGVLTAPRQWVESGAGYGALTLVPELLGGGLLDVAVTWIALAGWVLAVAVGWLLTRSRSRRLDVVAVAAPMTLVVMVTAQSVSTQTGLWVLPFLALSAVRWRDHLIWAGVEIVHFVGVWLYIGFGEDPGRGLPGDAYSVAVLARVAAWAWVLLQVWRAPGFSPNAAPPTVIGHAGAERRHRTTRTQ